MTQLPRLRCFVASFYLWLFHWILRTRFHRSYESSVRLISGLGNVCPSVIPVTFSLQPRIKKTPRFIDTHAAVFSTKCSFTSFVSPEKMLFDDLVTKRNKPIDQCTSIRYKEKMNSKKLFQLHLIWKILICEKPPTRQLDVKAARKFSQFPKNGRRPSTGYYYTAAATWVRISKRKLHFNELHVRGKTFLNALTISWLHQVLNLAIRCISVWILR